MAPTTKLVRNVMEPAGRREMLPSGGYPISATPEPDPVSNSITPKD